MARDGANTYYPRMTTTPKQMPDLLHRANALAKSGAFRDWTGVAQCLQQEGYDDAEAILGEQSSRVQINRTCDEAFRA
jgi:hypothetical protein